MTIPFIFEWANNCMAALNYGPSPIGPPADTKSFLIKGVSTELTINLTI